MFVKNDVSGVDGMNIAVIGSGYVGLVTGTCLAELGNNVLCVDINAEKIRMLKQGKSPIYEPGLEELIARNIEEKRIDFTTNLSDAVKKSKVIFIAVGTPQSNTGKADLRFVKSAAESVAKALDGEKVIVNKSTVPVGSGKLVEGIIKKQFKGKFHVVSNPEFLREGSAVNDFMQPDRVVVGSADETSAEIMRQIYSPLKGKILFTNVETAEMIKYASNAFLATKISFINEIANLCEKIGADVSLVAEGMGLDKRIGPQFLNAGLGYGGSCFPKDVQALIHIGKENGVDLKIIRETEEVNKKQKTLAVLKLEKALGNLQGRKIAVLGLAFKPNTDDMREAPSIEIVTALKKKGARVSAFDPVAEKEARAHLKSLKFAQSIDSALKGADAILLVTEWNEFKELDFEKAKQLMSGRVIVDGRNIYDRKKLEALGFRYYGIGK